MRYLPKSPAEREQMLKAIGAKAIDDLFAIIPAEYRLTRDLDVPRQQAESEIIDYFKAAGQKNATDYASFLGAGAYRHYRPVIIDSLVQRGEFLTSYTPYQAEITQGTLQAIFEFQTMIAELTGMDVANASMYDGSTGAAEAVLMAMRVTGRHKAVVASNGASGVSRGAARPTCSIAICPRREIGYDARDRTRGSGGAGGRGHGRDSGGAGAEPELLRRDRGHSGDCGDCAQEGRAADCVDCRGGFAGRGAAAGRSGHRQHGGAVVWRGAELRRAVLRSDRGEGAVSAADAGPAGGADGGWRMGIADLC